jgi:hypothetical protein
VSFRFIRHLSAREIVKRCRSRAGESVKRTGCGRVAAGRLSFSGHQGANKVAFTGRISRTSKLRPGRYELIITATSSVGQRSAPVLLRFAIVQA